MQPFFDTSQKLPKYPEQYLYKIPLLFSELSSSISNQVFGKFSSMFWYSPWVGSMHKSIMVRRPSTPFENIQPISQTFEYHGRDWRKSQPKRRSNIVLQSSLRRYCWNYIDNTSVCKQHTKVAACNFGMAFAYRCIVQADYYRVYLSNIARMYNRLDRKRKIMTIELQKKESRGELV